MDPGNWTAAAVPVNEGGTASFVATAYPANEAPDPALYGGTGMNPVTPNAENFSILEDKPARLYAIKDHIDWHTTYDSYTFDSGTGLSQTYFTVEDFVFNWAEGDGGVLTDTVSNWWANAGDSGWGTVKQQVNWPADTYIPSQNGDITSSVCDSNGCVAGAGTTGPPLGLVAGSACNVSYWDHCAVQMPPDITFEFEDGGIYMTTSTLQRNSDATVRWFSGGKAVPRRMSLVSLWADVLKLDPKTGGPGGTGIPGHLVQAGVFGQLGDDGMAYKMLADGQPYDLTLRVAGTEFTPGTERYTRFVNQPTEVTLQSLSVVSNASLVAVTNWAAVKTTSTNDYDTNYVTILATLSSNDTNAGNLIVWSGGQAVPGDPFLRRVSRATSDKTTVTASDGSSNLSLTVWIVWANVPKFNNTGPKDSDSSVSPLDYGVAFGAVNDTTDGDDRNGMLLQVTISPSGFGIFTNVSFQFNRTDELQLWVDRGPNAQPPGWILADSDNPGHADPPSSGSQNLVVTNAHLYNEDTPGLGRSVNLGGATFWEGSFVEWVEINLAGWQQCSDNYRWHSVSSAEYYNNAWHRMPDKPNEIAPGPWTMQTPNW